MPRSALPKHLRYRPHEDWPWPFCYIPRAWTAFSWGRPYVGWQGSMHNIKDWVDDYGSTEYAPNPCVTCETVYESHSDEWFHPKPITQPGSWQFSYFPLGPWFAWYFAFTTKGGIHFRIGARWDDVDDYVEFPSIAIKRGIK